MLYKMFKTCLLNSE